LTKMTSRLSSGNIEGPPYEMVGQPLCYGGGRVGRKSGAVYDL